jgi:hypothetical protein
MTSITGFMDKIDFDYELGKAKGGNVVYASVNDLAEHEPCCLKECGIVKVEVRLVEVVLATDDRPKEGDRLTKVSFGPQRERIATVGTYLTVAGKLSFVPDDPQPELKPERHVRIFGGIKKVTDEQLAEIQAFCEKYDLKTRVVHGE